MDTLDRTCSICSHDRKQPKLLTCLHVYCCQCLLDYVNKSLQDGQFPCPLCSVQIQLPSGGVKEFQDFSEGDDVSGSVDVVDSCPEDDDVSNMNDVAALTSYVGLCDMCKNQAIVKCRCKDCKQNICDSCKKIHSNIPVTKDHVIVDFVDGIEEEISEHSNHGNQNPETNDTSVDLCSVHTSKPIEIYCVECKTCMCFKCYFYESNRGLHNGHRILDLDNKDTQTKLRDDLKCLNINLQAQIDRLQQCSDHLTSKLSEIDICSEEACNKVDQQVQLISKLVQSRAEQIKTQINNTRHKERRKFEILRKEMEISITELKSDIKDSLITLEGESVVKIVERNERNRNDEMKVKQKDLVVPDLQFPGFLPGSDVREEVEKLVGEWDYFKQQNFTLGFNINIICAENSQEIYFDFCECTWFLKVRCWNDGTLGVYLFLSSDNMTGDNETSDNETSDNMTGDNETGDNETGDNKSSDHETSDNETGDNETSDNETSDNETSGDKTNDNETSGNETSGDKTNDNETSGNKTSGDKTNDNETSDNKTSDNKTRGNETGDNKKVKVIYSFTILNKVAEESRSRPHLTYEFEEGGGYGYGDFINLEELQNPENGFVDNDGKFSIRMSLEDPKDK